MPDQYGGGGGGITELAIVTEELAAAGCPLLLLVVSPAIVATIVARHGTSAQRSTWLPGFADGSLKVCFAITEPDAGSNFHRLTTVARRDGDGYVLDGRKVYISGVDEADNLRGDVSWVSPIARALIKAHVGDEVQLMTPGGLETLEVLDVRYPKPEKA